MTHSYSQAENEGGRCTKSYSSSYFADNLFCQFSDNVGHILLCIIRRESLPANECMPCIHMLHLPGGYGSFVLVYFLTSAPQNSDSEPRHKLINNSNESKKKDVKLHVNINVHTYL